MTQAPSSKPSAGKKGKAKSRSLPWLRRPRWRVVAIVGIVMIVLATLLYTVYAQRSGQTLAAGQPSPQHYTSPVDIAVIDPLATERERQRARNQIETVYNVDPTLRQLVIDATESAELPADVKAFVVDAYRQASGVNDAQLGALIDQAVRQAEPADRAVVELELEQSLLATAQPSPRLTEAARDAAAAAVTPVMQTLSAGQTIVRAGDILSADHLRVLEAVGLYSPRNDMIGRSLSTLAGCALLALLLALFFVYAYRHSGEQLTNNQIFFLGVLILSALAAQRLGLIADSGFLFIAVVPLLVAVLVSESSALTLGVWLSISVALFVPGAAFETLIVTLVGATASSLLARLFKSRASLLFAGALGGVAAGLSLVIYRLLVGGVGGADTVTTLLWIAAGGALAGITALGLVPVAESNVGFLTEFRLLELMSPSNPLLQKLLIEAPGSYQHSLIISNLVAQAVDNIGGNSLLARVGALYHDVGKLKRPQFFAENQFSGDNPHNQISPHLSYLIITSHVRDGVELLREYKLPKALEPFVLEHHGTTVLSYFYKRALENSARLDELNFRYPGPRPRSKETAVLMIADAVESASRTLTDPSQGSIRAMIDRLIEQRLQDDQFAESPLNYNDLENIANTFERMLTAVLHRRVRYPSAEEIQGLKRGRDSRANKHTPVPASKA